MSNRILLEIARCPEVSRCLLGNGIHPCTTIVQTQNAETIDNFQVPEPWSGRIQTAPILFISSNPSIGYDEIYPTESWNDDEKVDYFQNRFGGGRQEWIINGNQSLRKDGSYGHWTRFWAGVKGRAKELLNREPIPGKDYSLTELVHCKSRQEAGVTEALEKCVSLYLNQVLTISGARVLIGLGSLAKDVLTSEYQLPKENNLVGPLDISGKVRMLTFLPHPNAWKDKTFQKVITTNELQILRGYLTRGD